VPEPVECKDIGTSTSSATDEFRVQGSKFKVQSSKFRVQSSKLKVQSSKLKVQGSKNLSKKTLV
jgi:hypothetical protein